jgi:CheY-like chemotaxis protein
MVKKKILIIDDEKDFTQLVKMNLEATGEYEVQIENKGAAGLDAAKGFRPDLILLDILMPDMEGSEVASQLNEDNDTKSIPVVFLTAIVKENELKDTGGVIGGHRFVAKPVSSDKLIDIIKRTMAGD